MDHYNNPNLYILLLVITSTFISLLFLLPRQKPTNLPPGPTPFPIIGSLLELGDSPHRSLAHLAKAHGPILSLKLGQTTTIVVSSPQLSKQVLQTHDSSLSVRPVPHAVLSHGYHHVSLSWLPPTAQWKYLRALLKTHLFSAQPLDANKRVRHKKVEEMVEHVRGRGRLGQTVDIGRAAICTMMNVLSNYLFSVDMVDINSDKADEFKELVCRVLEEMGRPNVSDFFPVIGIMDLQGRKRKVGRYINKLYLIFDDLIDQRLEKMQVMSSSLDGSTHDFLDALVQLLVQGRDSRLDRPSIKALLFDNFVAGSDTSPITVEWAMAELLRHPSIMEKAHAELVSVVGLKGQVQESDIPQLPFLHAIVKETFRLHPVVPLLLPHKAETDHVELNGYMVPKNAKVLVNVWAIGRDESVWLDAESFRPERFMGSSEIDYRGRHFELTPFGSGRRICPGLPLAHRMVHLMLASLILSFQWGLPDGMKITDVDITDKFGLTLSLAVPLPAIPLLPVN